MSEVKQIAPENWSEFLKEFSDRNNNRRSRFEIFKGRDLEEEKQESFLEEVTIENDTITVTRLDRTEATVRKIHDKITNVTGISVQYDRDGSEDVLQINDKENEFILLRLESRIDGVS